MNQQESRRMIPAALFSAFASNYTFTNVNLGFNFVHDDEKEGENSVLFFGFLD